MNKPAMVQIPLPAKPTKTDVLEGYVTAFMHRVSSPAAWRSLDQAWVKLVKAASAEVG